MNSQPNSTQNAQNTEMNLCTKCQEKKPLTEFSFIQKRQQYFRWCRDCKRADLQQWRAANPRALPVLPIVYRIKNLVNGKAYIGVTYRPFEIRKTAHINASRRQSRFPIHAALRKYGIDNFTFDVIEVVKSIDELGAAEMRHIQQNDCMVPRGYNRTAGGGGMVGLRHSDDVRKAQSERHRGYQHSPEAIEKIRAASTGRVIPREAVERGRMKRTGMKRTAEQRDRISAALMGEGLGNQRRRVYPIGKITLAVSMIADGNKQCDIAAVTGLSASYVSNLATGKRGRYEGRVS